MTRALIFAVFTATLAVGESRAQAQGLAAAGQRGSLASGGNRRDLSSAGSSNACLEAKALAAFSCRAAVSTCSKAGPDLARCIGSRSMGTCSKLAPCIGSSTGCLTAIYDASRTCAETERGNKPDGAKTTTSSFGSTSYPGTATKAVGGGRAPRAFSGAGARETSAREHSRETGAREHSCETGARERSGNPRL